METWRLEKVVAWMREVARNDSTVGQTRKVIKAYMDLSYSGGKSNRT